MTLELLGREIEAVYLSLCLADNEYRKQVSLLGGKGVGLAAEILRERSRMIQHAIEVLKKEYES